MSRRTSGRASSPSVELIVRSGNMRDLLAQLEAHGLDVVLANSAAPRDALLAANIAPGLRGLAFGLHRAMDNAGAVIGPLMAWALLSRGVGIRFDGQEKTNVEEYCVSEGWIRVAVGKTVDRKGNPLTIKLKGKVEPYLQKP